MLLPIDTALVNPFLPVKFQEINLHSEHPNFFSHIHILPCDFPPTLLVFTMRLLLRQKVFLQLWDQSLLLAAFFLQILSFFLWHFEVTLGLPKTVPQVFLQLVESSPFFGILPLYIVELLFGLFFVLKLVWVVGFLAEGIHLFLGDDFLIQGSLLVQRFVELVDLELLGWDLFFGLFEISHEEQPLSLDFCVLVGSFVKTYFYVLCENSPQFVKIFD